MLKKELFKGPFAQITIKFVENIVDQKDNTNTEKYGKKMIQMGWLKEAFHRRSKGFSLTVSLP